MGRRLIRPRYLILVLTTALLLGFYSADLKAASILNCSVTGIYNQVSARACYELIRDWRNNGGDTRWYWNEDNTTKTFITNPKDIKYSYNLEQIAMQRAIEYTIANGHNRPNGETFSSFTYNGTRSYGECLLRATAGYYDAEDVFVYWQEEFDQFGNPIYYGGQGHRRCILNPDYDLIGIACVTVNGFDYWALEVGAVLDDCTVGTYVSPYVGAMTKEFAIDMDKVPLDAMLTLDEQSMICYLDTPTYDLPNASVRVKKSNQGITNGAPLDSSQYELTWTSGNSSIAKIENGKIVPVKDGSVTISAVAKIGDKVTSNVAALSVKVEKRSITEATVVEIADRTYTGNEICPEPVVKMGNVTLIKDTDYQLAYSDNVGVNDNATIIITGKGKYKDQTTASFKIVPRDISEATANDVASIVFDNEYHQPVITLTYNGATLGSSDYSKSASFFKDVGDYQVTIDGKGNFCGSKTVDFSITPRDIANCTAEEIADKVYTGEAITPFVDVYDGEDILDESNYDVSYSANIVPSEVTVTITGKGNYTGTLTTSFNIARKDISTIDIDYETEFTYSEGDQISPSVNLSFNEKPLLENVDYELEYPENVNAGEGQIIVRGIGFFCEEKILTFDIVPKDMSGFTYEPIDPMTYTGSALVPEIVISGTKETLVKDKDYEVGFADNINKGTATATITGKGNYTGTMTCVFEIEEKDIGSCGSYAVEDQTFTNAQIKPEVTITDGETVLVEGTDYTLEYGENKGAGTGSVKAKGMGNYKGELEISFNILSKSLENVSVSAIEGVTYTGEQHTPSVTVTDGEIVLVENTDYEVIYGENINKGEGTVTIKGIGNYCSEREVKFTILPKNINDTSISDIDSQIVTGSPIEPSITVLDGSEILENGTDYKLSYEDNTDPGTATVIIEGLGNYTGFAEKTFQICAKDLSNLTVDPVPAQKYNEGEPVCPEIVIRNGEYVLLEGVDYEVAYDQNSEIGTAQITVTGKGDYAGELIIEFTIAKDTVYDLTIENIDPVVYTGLECAPDPIVSDGELILTRDTDYELTYSQNINAGTAKILLKGINDYAGEVELTFTILPIDIEDLQVTGISSEAEFTGESKTIAPVIVFDTYELQMGTDYLITYENNINAGTASYTISGIGNFTGTLEGTFEISSMSIDNLTFEEIESQVYTGSALNPDVVIKNGEIALELGTDYEVICEDAIAAGTHQVTVNGKGNYSGTKTLEFVISAKDISDLEAEEIADLTYTGSEIRPVPVIKYGKLVLNDEDHDLTYSENINVGSALVLVEGKGNYSGSVTLGFNITASDISDYEVSGLSEKTYTGLPLMCDIEVSKDGTVLDPSTDYSVFYKNNINAGTAEVTIVGGGNYKGSIDKTFNIAAMSIENMTIEVISDETYTGFPIVPSVSVTNGETALNSETDITVSCSDNTNVGEASVLIEGVGNYCGILNSAFNIVPKDGSALTVEPVEDAVYTGGPIEPSIVIRDGEVTLSEDQYDISYSNNTAKGEASILIQYKGNYTGTGNATFNIVSKTVDSLTINDIPEAEYTGSPIYPTVTVYDGETVVSEDDYKIYFSSNTNAGEATIRVEGQNNYSGSKNFTFKINAKDISGFNLSGITGEMTFTGSEITQSVVVSDGNTDLGSSDYDVTYSNNINVGEAKVTVEGKGNYKGKIEATFSITRKDFGTVTVDSIPDQAFTESYICPEITVKDGSRTLVENTDYKVSFSDNKAIGEGQITVNGIGNYDGTKTVTFKIVQKNVTALDISAISSQTYNGSAITPKPTVKNGNTTLKEGTDYSISYSNNVNAGTATVTITGKGNYKGSKSVSFSISKKTVSGLTISSVSAQDHTGKAITPKPTVKDGSKTLIEGTDYRLSYKNNTNTGTATITVTGAGNYSGTKDVTFTIKAKPTPAPTAKPTTPTPTAKPTSAPTPTPKPTPTEAPKDAKSDIRGFVERLYNCVLGRPSEPGGIDFWTDELYEFRQTGAQVAVGFIGSKEFKDRNTSDSEFLDILYRTFFNREPDDGGKNYWLSELRSGKTRDQVAMGFIDSQEWADTCASYGIKSGGSFKSKVTIAPTNLTLGFVERMYTTALGRDYDTEGRDFWAKPLANFEMTGEQVGINFFNSAEFKGFGLSDDEFLERLYLTFMDRPSDEGGKNFWKQFLKDGHSREEVVLGFTRSAEFVEKCIEARILPY